ncbi:MULTISPECIES: PEP-CTERM sorting domain-containing protein [unclassified Agarivorans]|uniref:PEP-CTERM sorting domain-containing protein n=1 Tax=unclassified Agarivorans TaxID=2636026 RepID=UPI003D7CD0F9
MKIKSLVITATTYSLLLSCNAMAGQINFDDIIGRGVAWEADRYLNDEVYFASDQMYAWQDPSPQYGGQNLATSGLTYIYAGATSSATGAFSIQFFKNGDLNNPGATDNIQFDVIDYIQEQTASWGYEAFDIQGNSLLSGLGTGSSETVNINLDIPIIHSVTFTPSTDTDGMDSLVFGDVVSVSNNQVPEPATLALFTLGLTGIVFRRKRPVKWQ